MKQINSEYCVVSFVNQIKPNKKPWFTVNENILMCTSSTFEMLIKINCIKILHNPLFLA